MDTLYGFYIGSHSADFINIQYGLFVAVINSVQPQLTTTKTFTHTVVKGFFFHSHKSGVCSFSSTHNTASQEVFLFFSQRLIMETSDTMMQYNSTVSTKDHEVESTLSKTMTTTKLNIITFVKEGLF